MYIYKYRNQFDKREKVNALDEDCKRSSVRVTYDKNMQIVDTNNYYPFGMNHLRDDAPSNLGGAEQFNYQNIGPSPIGGTVADWWNRQKLGGNSIVPQY